MTDIKKINIYMGVVGQAYVDKETAKKNLEAAEKNVLDVKHIIYLINHLYENEFLVLNDENYPLITTSYLDEAQSVKGNAQAAKNLASTVVTSLQEMIELYPQSSSEYKQLSLLIENLNEGKYMELADQNIASVEASITELNDILRIAQELLGDNEAYCNECETEFNNATEILNAYLPEETESQADRSDELEAQLIERLNNVAENLENAQAISESITQTYEDAQNAAHEIANSGIQPEEPETEETYYWYVGTTVPTDPTDSEQNTGLNQWTSLGTTLPTSSIQINKVDTTYADHTWYIAAPTAANFTLYNGTNVASNEAGWNKSTFNVGSVQYTLWTSKDTGYQAVGYLHK